MELENYQCQICKKRHAIFRAIKSPLPELIVNIPEAEREGRITEFHKLLLVDGQWILGEGCIHILMENLDEPVFHWYVWVSISPTDFKKKIDGWETSNTIEVSGTLLSEIPFYAKSEGLRVKVVMVPSPEKPFEVVIEEPGRFKDDQSKPISEDRLIELMQHIHHQELFKPEKVFDKPFSARLEDELNYVEEHYIKAGKLFAINICTSSKVLFQVVNSTMLEVSQSGKPGFGFDLPFDDSFEEIKEDLGRFLGTAYASEFEHHNLGDIATYQLDVGNDKARLEYLISRLVEDVFEYDLEKVEIEHFEVG